MRGTIGFSLKVEQREVDEVIQVVDWMARGARHWPKETLDWLVGGEIEPGWFALLHRAGREAAGPDAAEAAGLERTRADARADLLHLRDAIVAADAGDGDRLMIDSIPSSQDHRIALELRRSGPEAPWSTLTVLDEAGRLFRSPPTDPAAAPERDAAASSDWMQLEVGAEAPSDWKIFSSDGWDLHGFAASGEDATTIEAAASAASGGRRHDHGRYTVEPGPSPRIDVAEVVLPAGRGLIRSGSLTVARGRRGRLRVTASGRALVVPLWLNLMTPALFLTRPLVGRIIAKQVQSLLDRTVADPAWPAMVAAARRDVRPE